jgi:predicted transcriptional regulator
MPTVKYSIKLTPEEKDELNKIIKTGKSPAQKIMRANILLNSDSSAQKPMTVADLANLLKTTTTTVQNVRTEYVEKGLEATLNRKKRKTPPVAPKVNGEFEAHLIALSCTKPPDGYARWTVRLLSEKCVEFNYIDAISPMTISRTLKKRI